MDYQKPGSSSSSAAAPARPGDAADPEATQYLAQSGFSLYGTHRPRQDNCWTIAYCLLAALVVIWGIVPFVSV